VHQYYFSNKLGSKGDRLTIVQTINTAVVLPSGMRSLSTYDAVGNLQSMTDFNGEITRYVYDAQNRLVLKDFEDDADVSYTYTLNGQVNTITDGRGVTTYGYDERDRLSSQKDPTGPYTSDSYSLEYTYDLAGNRTSVETPSGTVSYTFDERNRLQTVTDSDQRQTTYFYDTVNNLIRTTLPNGVEEIREYNSVNQLEFMKNIKIDPISNQQTILTSYDYVLDAMGHRLSVTDHTGRKVDYDYDNLYRLEQEKIIENNTTRTIDFSYDNVGNRLSQVDSVEGTTTYVYDVGDRLLSETTAGVTTTYTYDNNGNTISKQVTGQPATTYTWNDDNRLVAVITAEGNVLSYTYDTDGIRTSSTINGVTTNYLVDKNRDYAQVLEESINGQLQVNYVYGHDLISQERGSQTSFYHVDGLGSTTALTNELSNLSDTYTYSAFGELIEKSGNSENAYQFTGEPDGETNE
jgi:YD repeat-containing protein